MPPTGLSQAGDLSTLVQQFPRSVVVIDLEAIAANVRALSRLIGPACSLMAVVKADAYGHGAVPVAITALQSGAGALAVACVDEGVALRQAGLTAPILLLGATPPEEMARVVGHQLMPTICDPVAAQALQVAAANLRRPVYPLHVKVDTGLHRFGVAANEAVDFVSWLQCQPRLRIAGLYTHFSCAEEEAGGCTYTEFQRFMAVAQALEQRGLRPVLHAANSAAILRYPGLRLGMVRAGIAVYGLAEPVAGGQPIAQRPALQLHSRISRRLTLAPGAGVGYGRTYIATEERQAALVGIGYGDGYRRQLSNRGQVLIEGRRVPVIGRVSMDQIVVDVTDVPAAMVGTPVTLIGAQAGAEISAAELAAWTETIPYEVVTGLAPRLPRAYLAGGQLVAISDLLGQRALTPRGAGVLRWGEDNTAGLAVAP